MSTDYTTTRVSRIPSPPSPSPKKGEGEPDQSPSPLGEGFRVRAVNSYHYTLIYPSFINLPIMSTPLDAPLDTKAFRRSLHHSDRYNRKGFGLTEEVSGTMDDAYKSGLIQTIRNNNFSLTQGKVTIRLAQAFGFCWGVERAVAMAYETRKHFPQERIWITNEIIHNPSVNQHLRDMSVEFIDLIDGEKDFSGVQNGDVVILPAFGASVQEMQLLNDRGCQIVDTTCPWVSKVWNTVEKHKKVDYTSIIHGKYKHEETIATSSFANKYLDSGYSISCNISICLNINTSLLFM